MSDSDFYREKSREYLAQNDGKVLFWIKQKTEIGPQKKILLRICDATKFGLSFHGFTPSAGQFYTTLWTTALKMFAPHSIEIFGSVNPLPYLVYTLTNLDEQTRSVFLAKVRQISVRQTDVQIEELEILLNFLPNLILFSLADVVFGREEMSRLMKCLEKSQLQAMALCPTYTILNSVGGSNDLQLQVVHFCSGQGAKVSDLNLFKKNFPLTTMLYVQESAFDESLDAEEGGDEEVDDTKALEALQDSFRVVEQLRRIFPVLQTLIFDWNIVEPYTEASSTAIQKLIEWLRDGELERIAIPIYTPYSEILKTIEKIREQFKQKDFESRIYRFCTRGANSPNFALLLITKDPSEIINHNSVAYRIHEIFVTDSYTVIDDLALLLYIANGNTESYKQFYATNANIMSIDFGGFNNVLVDEKYRQRQT